MEFLKKFVRVRLLLITVSICMVLVACSLFKVTAQQQEKPTAKSESSPAAAPSQTATPQPTPIPVSQIIAEKEKAENRLQEIKKLAEQSPVSRIQADLEELLKDLDAKEQETNEVLSNNPSLEDLNKTQQYWASVALSLPSRKTRLQTQAAEISAQLAEIKTSQTIWGLTRSAVDERTVQPNDSLNANVNTGVANNPNANVQGLNSNSNVSGDSSGNANLSVNGNSTGSNSSPPENDANSFNPPENLKIQVAEILEKLKQAQRVIQMNFNQMLALQEKLSAQEKRISEMEGKISATRTSLLSNLTFRDSPPIWSPESFADGFQQNFTRSSSLSLTALGRYFSTHWGLFLFHLLIILGLLLGFRHARLRTREMVKREPKLKPALIIFESPTASALIVGLFFGPVLYFDAPELLGVIISPLLVFAIFYLFSKLVERRYFPILVALVLLYLINDLRLLAAPISLLSRLVFLVEMAGGVIFLGWLIRSKNPVGISHTLRIICIFILILFAFAFLINALGFRSLARVVGTGLVSSLTTGLIFYALVKVADSLLIFLFRIPPFSKLIMIRNHRTLIQQKIFGILKWLAIIIWFAWALIQFYLFDSFINLLEKALDYEIIIGTVTFSPSSILLLIFIVWLSFLLSRFIRFALDEDIYPRVHLAKGLPYAASTILHYLILLGGIFLALAAAGIDLTKFTIFLGALGVGVGIGLQNIVENFTSGLILLLERPVKVGDTIQMSKYQGQLKHIGLRSSIVKTGEGAEVIVPNGQLITEEVTNWTLSDQHRRLDINVGVEYGANPDQVIKLLEEVGLNHPDALPENPARAIFLGFGESSLDFQLRVWTANQDRLIYIKSDLATGVYHALKNTGIEIPFPQRDLHLKSSDEKQLNAVKGKTKDNLAEETE